MEVAECIGGNDAPQRAINSRVKYRRALGSQNAFVRAVARLPPMWPDDAGQATNSLGLACAPSFLHSFACDIVNIPPEREEAPHSTLAVVFLDFHVPRRLRPQSSCLLHPPSIDTAVIVPIRPHRSPRCQSCRPAQVHQLLDVSRADAELQL